MRKQDVNRKLFHRAHYNILAKQFRDQFTRLMEAEKHFADKGLAVDEHQLDLVRVQTGMLTVFAIAMANRLALDNEDFKPEMFLDACSPEDAKGKLGQFWQGRDDSEVES